MLLCAGLQAHPCHLHPPPQLRNALAESGGNVPGFMLVADCLVRGGKDGGEGRFSGMIMGELHGERLRGRAQARMSLCMTQYGASCLGACARSPSPVHRMLRLRCLLWAVSRLALALAGSGRAGARRAAQRPPWLVPLVRSLFGRGAIVAAGLTKATQPHPPCRLGGVQAHGDARVPQHPLRWARGRRLRGA